MNLDSIGTRLALPVDVDEIDEFATTLDNRAAILFCCVCLCVCFVSVFDEVALEPICLFEADLIDEDAVDVVETESLCIVFTGER